MIRFLLIAIVFCCVDCAVAQNAGVEVHKSTDPVYSTAAVDVLPSFPGGMEAFYEYISKNFTPPNIVGLSGKVIAIFIVETDGTLGEISIVRDVGYGSGPQLQKVLELAPKWIPGSIAGEPVRVRYALPVAIKT